MDEFESEEKKELPLAIFKIDNKVFLFGVVLLIGAMGYSLFLIQSDGASCLASPGNFLASELEESNEAPVSCSCTIAKGTGGIYSFDKDSESLTSNQAEYKYKEPINFSPYIAK